MIKNRRLSITVLRPSRQFNPIPQARKHPLHGRVAFALGHAGAVSVKTDLYARKEGMKVLKALKKVGKAEEKRTYEPGGR